MKECFCEERMKERMVDLIGSDEKGIKNEWKKERRE